MAFTGIQAQKRKNNFNSLLLLILFPVLLLVMFWAIIYFINLKVEYSEIDYYTQVAPIVIVAVGIWFLIAFAFHSKMIKWATGSRTLERKENKRVYNLVENLCIANGMPMPKVFIIEDDSLNAFASGINKNTYAISLSRGIINKLDDDELEAVIAHELTHIINNDTKLLIVSIVFVGIFAFLAEMAFRSLRHAGNKRNSKDNKGAGSLILIIVVITAVAYLISILLRFGISKKREYIADAGASEITKKPYALANALKKITADPCIEAVENRDVAQMFIYNPVASKLKSSLSSWNNLFSTHPPVEKRIEYLEQFV